MFKSILVPVDLAEMDVVKPALEKAIALSALTGGSLHLVYVRSILPVTFMEYVPPSFDEEQQAECEKKMAEVVANLPVIDKSKVTTAVRMGAVYNEVLSEAEKQACDLIVVGSHHPSMSTYLLGSNAATIVRHAPCSVLVVRL
ncbi:MAG: universal stress protein [Beijerinckiaceae bacterium]|nr:universal stress protein [Beijerinckiaceae bacterium]